jgi:hypothetical protein
MGSSDICGMEIEDSDLVLTVGPDGNLSPANNVCLKSNVQASETVSRIAESHEAQISTLNQMVGSNKARRVLQYPDGAQAAGATCPDSGSSVGRKEAQRYPQEWNEDDVSHEYKDADAGCGADYTSATEQPPGGAEMLQSTRSPPRPFLTKSATCRHSSDSSQSRDVSMSHVHSDQRPSTPEISALGLEDSKQACLDTIIASSVKVSSDTPRRRIHVSMNTLERINKANSAHV